LASLISAGGKLRVAQSVATPATPTSFRQAMDIADQIASADATDEARRRVLTLRDRVVPGAGPTTLAEPLLPDASVWP